MSQAVKILLEQRKQAHVERLKNWKKSANWWVLFRLMCFVIIGSGFYILGASSLAVVLCIAMLLTFVFGVQKSAEVADKVAHEEKIIAINEREIGTLDGLRFGLSHGKEYEQPEHEYAFDLDLLTPNGLFERVNRSSTQLGQDQLAQWMLSPSYQSLDISHFQTAIRELSEAVDWRQNFMAQGFTMDMHQRPGHDFKADTFIPTTLGSKVLANIVTFFPLVSLGVLAAYGLDILSGNTFMILMLLPLLVVGAFQKKIKPIVRQFETWSHQLSGLSAQLALIEQHAFSAHLLSHWRKELINDDHEASKAISELSSALSSYEQRSNLLLGIVLNAFMLWDIKYAIRMAQWHSRFGIKMANWNAVVSYFDALNGMANYVHTHPSHVFPEVALDTPYYLRASNVKHPFLGDEGVGNNFSMEGKGQVTIITGANMAGKSTFLRTIGMSLVMGSMGLPVLADDFCFAPIPVFTSMRTHDSLAKNASFFHAEISRLKQLFTVTQNDQPRFVILDEILKGTNSEDKARGSYAFVKKLLSKTVMGIIATHDLSLCELAKVYPSQVHNRAFEVEIENNELHFDYTLRTGVCQNLNASFLLQKMGLVDQY